MRLQAQNEILDARDNLRILLKRFSNKRLLNKAAIHMQEVSIYSPYPKLRV